MISINKLPNTFKNENTISIYNKLKKKWPYRFIKRTFDIFASFLLIVILFVPSLIIAFAIGVSSKGGVFFTQVRVGRYGKDFKIFKFRTMTVNSEGNQRITQKNDSRVTKIGKFLRKTHMDEFPQLLNVFAGQMSFVGSRPEVREYVEMYQPIWFSTLLMRPGITSTASINYDDEAKLLEGDNTRDIYINKIVPMKMKDNLHDLEKSEFFYEIGIMFKTVFRKRHD